MDYDPVNSVFPRLEYKYGDKDRLLAPKLDAQFSYGTYGVLEIQVIWYYPIIPGKLYHPVDNPAEASWWLEYYRSLGTAKNVYFTPAPDQESVGTFVVPDIPEDDNPVEEVVQWYLYQYDRDEYTK